MASKKIWLLKKAPFERSYSKTSKIDLHYLNDGIELMCVNGIEHGQRYIKIFDEYNEIDLTSYLEHLDNDKRSVQKFRYELNDCYFEVYPNNMLVLAHGNELPVEWKKLVLLDVTDIKQFGDFNLAI